MNKTNHSQQTGESAQPSNREAKMTRHILKRTGQPPLMFIGQLLSSADNEFEAGNLANRWTKVQIFKTRAGKFIAYLSAYSRWKDESNYFKCAVFSAPGDLFAALKNDEELGEVSQSAIEKACAVCPEIESAFREFVD